MRELLKPINKYDVNNVLIKLFLLFPFTTLFQNYFSYSNIILLGIVGLVLFVRILSARKLSGLLILLICTSTTIWIISLLNTSVSALKTNVNMAVYYIFMFVYYIYFICERDRIWSILNYNKQFVYYIVFAYSLLISISVFLPSSYTQMTAGGWGTDKYFVSFSGSPNRVGPACLFILVLITFLIKIGYKRKLCVLFTLPHLFTVAMGGSRTYFVLGMCVLFVIAYFYIDNIKIFRLLIPIIIIGVVVIVIKSNMLNKIIATFQYTDNQVVFWQKLTNTRSIFWVDQFKLFWNTSLINHFIGNGINFTTYNYGLWAHSDFLEILCSYGYIGLFCYLVLISYLLRIFLKNTKSNKLIVITVVFVWFFNAFFNFFYCYFCAMLCYPFLLLLVSKERRAVYN